MAEHSFWAGQTSLLGHQHLCISSPALSPLEPRAQTTDLSQNLFQTLEEFRLELPPPCANACSCEREARWLTPDPAAGFASPGAPGCFYQMPRAAGSFLSLLIGSAPSTQRPPTSLTSAHGQRTALELTGFSASPSQGKPRLAPSCYFWLCFCLWDPLTFSNENKTAAAPAFGSL